MSGLLVCMPYAGSGANAFRSWGSHPFAALSLEPVQLAGREERFLDRPSETLSEAVADCLSQVTRLPEGAPVSLFGHSFGALLAYETAHRLAAGGERPVVRLIVSGAVAPQTPRHRHGLGELSDDEIVAHLGELVGYRHTALDHPELRELLLPVLRADLTIADEYRPTSLEPLDVPITALRGRDDRLVSPEEASAWRAVTTQEFDLVELAGDHMYFADDWRPLAAVLDAISARGLQSAPGRREL